MTFDCVVIKQGTAPFIHKVCTDYGDFDIMYPERGTHEIFTLEKYEFSVKSQLVIDIYLVANKAGVSRAEVEAAIRSLNPTPFRRDLN